MAQEHHSLFFCAVMQTLFALRQYWCRVFSFVSSIKTKARNCLHTKTVRALLKVTQGVKESGGCIKFSPPGGARQWMSSDILCTTTSNADSDSDQLWFYIKLLHSVSTLNLWTFYEFGIIFAWTIRKFVWQRCRQHYVTIWRAMVSVHRLVHS